MNITLYAICKNEEKNIENFIENSKKFSHTVVVDTGSTDNTVQLLKDAGIEVYEHPQTREEFDFSKARNQALSYITTDWAFSLDFNENVYDLYLDQFGAISEDLTRFNHERYDRYEEETTKSDEIYVRFHRTKNYKWINAVHEIPVSVDTAIKITKKINRSIGKDLFYLNICEREYKKDSDNWYYVWFIYNHYLSVQNFEKALEYGQEFLNLSKPYFNTFRIPVFINCSQLLFMSGDTQKGANYAFHAVSEAMNMGEPYMSRAFSYLFEISKKLNNPNITIFASGFNPDTLSSPERQQAIKQLYEIYI